MRVVLDTNVIVSSFLAPLGAPARLVAVWRTGAFELIISSALLAELTHTLNYPRLQRRHGFTPERVTAEVLALRDIATVIEPEDVPAVVQADPDDDHVVAAAVAGGADYIVTGDPDLLALRQHRGVRILTPRMFLHLLEEEGYPER
jgi:putative PIN family toxin of toxin-antitoxin system